MQTNVNMAAYKAQLKTCKWLFDLTEASIAPEVRAKLPANGKVMGFHLSEDMDGLEYQAIMYSWVDSKQIRIANFRLSDGSYVDDWII